MSNTANSTQFQFTEEDIKRLFDSLLFHINTLIGNIRRGEETKQVLQDMLTDVEIWKEIHNPPSYFDQTLDIPLFMPCTCQICEMMKEIA